LLGDAAHPTLQALAQGACMAIEDGVCIADLIEQCGGDFEVAFAQFQEARVERTAKVIFESRYMWKVLHPEGAERAPVHKHFRTMSRDDVWNSLAWLYDGFKVPAFQKR
jgi:salicylate hydroxylase